MLLLTPSKLSIATYFNTAVFFLAYLIRNHCLYKRRKQLINILLNVVSLVLSQFQILRRIQSDLVNTVFGSIILPLDDGVEIQIIIRTFDEMERVKTVLRILL